MHRRRIDTIDQRRLALLFNGLALVIVGLHLYVATLPPTPTAIPTATDAESRWWGVWPVTYVPGWLVIGGALIVVAVIVVAWQQRHNQGWTLPQGWSWSVVALLFGAFWLFPLVHTRWGDAYTLAKGMAWPDPALRLTHSWQAPLDVYLHSQVWDWLHPLLGMARCYASLSAAQPAGRRALSVGRLAAGK